MTILTQATDTIEVPASEMDEPILLELNQIFGAIGLRYTVAVEAYGIVQIKRNSGRAQLYVSAGEFAEAGARTRLVIRADDGTGCNAAITFKLKLVDAAATSRVA